MKYTVLENLPLLETLQKLSPQSSKTTLRSWLKEDRVMVDGRLQKLGSTPVFVGQVISVGSKQKFIDEGVRIVFEDKHLVVVDKPAGILTVSTAFEKGQTVHAFLKKKYYPKNVYVVHRLDQDTSGVMMFTLSEESRDLFKDIFEKHAIKRAYCAIVEGAVKEEKGSWESYLYEDARYMVRETEDPTKGRLAITHFEVHAATSKYSLLDMNLETGRKNQIRVHCQKAGHSVVGDKKYGATSNPLKRLCLHAYLLSFTHPFTKKEMKFESPIPEDFYRLLKLPSLS